MSLNSLSNDSLRRQVITQTLSYQTPPAAMSALESGVVSSASILADTKAVNAVDANAANKTVNALVKYIPTEMLASFVAATSIASTFNWSVQLIYLIWIIATPLIFLLIHYSKLASAKEPWPTGAELKRVLWLTFAAMLAFIVWGLSVPMNPAQKETGPVLAAFLAGIASPLLNYAEPIVFRIIDK